MLSPTSGTHLRIQLKTYPQRIQANNCSQLHPWIVWPLLHQAQADKWHLCPHSLLKTKIWGKNRCQINATKNFWTHSTRQVNVQEKNLHTPKLYVNLAINKLIATKDLTEATPFVCSNITRWMAKWKAVIIVCLLWIVIRTHFIYP